MTNSKPHAIIIGAGFTGCATAYDLALRGFKVTVVERGDIASGTSGRTHGLLHSGARYCVEDIEAGKECYEENVILRRISSQCIEYNQGLFIALNENDLEYRDLFIQGARQCGIPVEEIAPREALRLEPNLNASLLTAFIVPDGVFAPMRLALAFAASAKLNSADFLTYTDAKDLMLDGNGNVTGVEVVNRHNDENYQLHGDILINATGVWAGEIVKNSAASVPILPTPGVMVAYDQRLTQHVLNRLNYPGDGDILIPQRRMVVIGTTSFESQNLDYIPVYEDQVEQMHKNAVEFIPSAQNALQRGAFMSARPLIQSIGPGRSISRTFKCYDHQENEGIGGLITVIGGKATTCRVMGEKTADLVCRKLGITATCETRERPLASYREYYQSRGATIS